MTWAACLVTVLTALMGLTSFATAGDDLWLTFAGGDGPGKGKHIVLVGGDEEYRSEEVLPQLAKILSQRYGFTCTVLFAIDPLTNTIDPRINDNIPGLAVLDNADLMIVFTRWRKLPDEQMKHLVDYIESGRPIIGIRTATHAFENPVGTTYAKYASSNGKSWPGGFGKQVLGETWVNHHGDHGKESTRGVFAPGAADHPILRGIADGELWGPSDVYTINLPLPGDSKPLVLGQVLTGMKPTDPPLQGKKNDPMMPIVWTKTYTGTAGKPARVLTTTFGSGVDFENEGYRRLLVNGVFWALGMEEQIPAKADVSYVGRYKGSPFGFAGKVKEGFKPGRKPTDLR